MDTNLGLVTPHDAVLVERARQGDRDAFAEIVRRYQGLVCSLAYCSVGHVRWSEDIAQETFVAAWQGLDQLREPGKLRGWLCGIARRTSLNARRAEAREPSARGEALVPGTEAPSEEAGPAERAIHREEADLVWRALAGVPEIFREPLVLYYREHHSVERVAQALELSEDAVKQRLARGREHLKAEVASLVDGALRDSGPGRAFAEGVMAALPVTTVSAKVAIGAAVAGKSGTAIAGAGAAVGGALLGLLGGYFGFRLGLDRAQSEAERRIIRGMARVVLGSATAVVVMALAAVFAARTWGHALWITVGLTAVVVPLHGVVVSVAIVRGNRKIARLRPGDAAIEGTGGFEYRSRWELGGLPLVHVKFGETRRRGFFPVKAWIAAGSVAWGGIFALGGIAVAPIAVGGMTLGLVSVGGCVVGAVAIGGLGIGGLVLAGTAVGWVAIAGTAFGWKAALGGMACAHEFAQGGLAHAAHANDVAAQAYFAQSRSVSTALRAAVWLPWLSVLGIWPILLWYRESRNRLARRRHDGPGGLLSLALLAGGCLILTNRGLAQGASLSPGDWPTADREQVERLESLTVSPPTAQTVESSGGVVSATVSPISVFAGVQALRQGGNAADAAATVALTQITTQLGSVVSYAGIFTMLYYDAHSGKVYSMDAGYNSYLGETDPLTIPVSDLGILNYGRKPTQGGAKGRETLVPGFMAGVEALHQRFGRLPFRDLFAPAIWYDEHGVRISPVLGWYFGFRAKALARTPEGRRFLRQGGGDFPQVGALFVQTDLAKTLREVAAGGVPAMYTGRWARDFVAIVGREGGKATLEDLRRYRPIWSEPRAEVFFGHTVYANGGPHYGARYLFNGLRRAQALHLEGKGPYWTDAGAFADLAGIVATEGLDDAPHHSNAIVVVDRDGNIAAVTHTINSVIWGDTGIVVDGIPIPDSAGFQQKPLAMLQPGERVPHKIIDAIAFDGRQPVLATASIGSSLIPESIRTLLAVLGQHQSLATVMAAPPFLSPEGLGVPASATAAIPVQIPQGAYRPEFLAELKARSLAVVEVPAPTADGVRGTLAAVAINPATHRRSAADQPGVMVFNRAE